MNRKLRKTVATVATCMALVSPALAKKKPKDPDQIGAAAASAAPATPAAQGGPVAAPTVESSAPPSKTLERALKLYDSEDYYMSSIELNKVVERSPIGRRSVVATVSPVSTMRSSPGAWVTVT